jgi:DNA-binding transcriptional LysR family regulator
VQTLDAVKLQTIEALIAVVEAGSIRRAADRLHVSQPALTLALQQLEAELHAPLLIRTKQGVLPTAFGEAFLKRARSIAAEAARAKDEVAQLRGRWEGTIRFATSPAMALVVLPRAMKAFREAHPGVRMHLVDGLYPAVGPALREGVLDFALTPVHLNQIEADLAAEPLYVSDIVVVARRHHPLAAARSVRDLQACEWIFSSAPRGPGAVVQEAFASLDLGEPRRGMTCESFLALPGIVATSDLLTTMPRALLQHNVWHEQLVAVPVAELLPCPTICVLRRHDMPLTPAAQQLTGWIRHFATERAANSASPAAGVSR